MSRKCVYDFKGNREIRVRRTNGNKLTFTAILAITMDGTKLPPIFTFKTRSPVPQSVAKKYKNRALLYTNASECCIESIFKDWTSRIWLNLNLQENQQSFLVMDKFSVHELSSVQNLLKEGNSLYTYLPPGTTGLLQPLDTQINKDYKEGLDDGLKLGMTSTDVKKVTRPKKDICVLHLLIL